MSAYAKLPIYIQTRGFSNSPIGSSLASSDLFSGITNSNESIYDTIELWNQNDRLHPGLKTTSTTNGGTGVAGLIFLPGVFYNTYGHNMTDIILNHICLHMEEPDGLSESLRGIVGRDIFGRRRRRGIWEILLIKEAPLNEFVPKIRQFKMAVIKIQRNRRTFYDRYFTKRGVSFQWRCSDLIYDPNYRSD
jgi:hypothetical protein